LESRSENFDRIVIDALNLHAWDRPRMRLLPIVKRIIEDFSDSGLNSLRSVNRDRSSEFERKKPNIIKPMQMICMLMGVKNCMHQRNLLPKQLMAQIGGCIDEQIAFG
jgi:hypothetical protein